MSVDAQKLIALLFFLFALPGGAAADDPFWGVWKLNPQKSVLVDQQFTIEDLGNGGFKFTFGSQSYPLSYAIAADGKEHQVRLPHTPLTQQTEFMESIVRTSPNTWKVVSKQNGRVAESTWVVSEDGKTLRVQGNANPHQLGQDVLYRAGDGSGFPGVWRTFKSEKDRAALAPEIDIAPYKQAGLSIVNPAKKNVRAIEFDSGNYPQEGVKLLAGSSADNLRAPSAPFGGSATRIDSHTLRIASKVSGTVVDQAEYQVSPDGSTLKVTQRDRERQGASEIVYERQSLLPSAIRVAGGSNGFALDRNGDLLVTSRDCVYRTDLRTHKQSAVACGLHFPSSVVADRNGNVFIADTFNDRVLKVSANGSQSTVGSGLTRPMSIAVDERGDLVVALLNQRDPVKISPDGAQSTIHPDGEYPISGIAMSPAGNLLIADTGYDRVIQMPLSGKGQTTIPAFGLNMPFAIAADAKGSIFIADTGNGRVVEVTQQGLQRTVLIGLNHPSAVAVDGAGHLFVADSSSVLEVSTR